MMEHIFKAKRLDNGEWIEGYYLVAAGMTFISAFGIPQPVAVDCKTVCAYTQMRDGKGNRIFQNDIVKASNHENLDTFDEWDDMVAVVEWYLDGWRFKETGYVGEIWWNVWNDEGVTHLQYLEVVGNIMNELEEVINE